MLTFNGVKWFCLAVKYAGFVWSLFCAFMLAMILLFSKGLIARRGYKEYELRDMSIYLMFQVIIGSAFYLMLPSYSAWAVWLEKI